MTPEEPLVADLVSRLSDSLREDFEERAAIVEYEANTPRAHAQCLALIDVLRRNPTALLGIESLLVELEGCQYVALATSQDNLLDRLGSTGPAVIRRVDLGGYVRQQCDGVALVTRAA